MEFSLGLVEVSALGNAIMMLDEMTKVADVEFVACERKLGGRLVTIVVKGSVSAVTASVETGKAAAIRMNCFKAAEVIARPHKEILKFLHLDEEAEAKVNSESAASHQGKVPSEAKEETKPEPVKKTATKKAATPTKGTDKKAPVKRSTKK
ncbi:MAG: BMC domain-containing protein [Clostridia bacterium]|nr:BMC domain-containing protein [Clostridia bacterium]